MNPSIHSSKAFSLLELIIVLVVIAVVISIGIPGITQARSNAERETMRSRAMALQTAKQSYISAVGTLTAHNNWVLNNDQSDYALLSPYLPGSAPSALSSYIVNPPYQVSMEGLGSSVNFYTISGSHYYPTSLQKY